MCVCVVYVGGCGVCCVCAGSLSFRGSIRSKYSRQILHWNLVLKHNSGRSRERHNSILIKIAAAG